MHFLQKPSPIARSGWLAAGLAASVMCLPNARAQGTAEVACPSELFPSPTGIYRNTSSAMTVYGATVQIRIDRCHLADRSVPPPKGSAPAVSLTCVTTHLRVLPPGATTPTEVTVPMNLTLRLAPGAAGLPL